MSRRNAAAAFHQFGNILLAVAAMSFVALPLASLLNTLVS
jgi:Na+/phosphate symporter